jgi:hypothetical protein
MRTTTLTRAAVAVASLAVGSAALVAAPATAATPSADVTRTTVLTAADGWRAAQANDTRLSTAASRALRTIAVIGCDVDIDQGERLYLRYATAATVGDDADGVLVTVRIQDDFTQDRDCTVGAFAPTDAGFQLSGSATISESRYDSATNSYVSVPVLTSVLSGDATVTGPVLNSDRSSVSATASGNATKTTKVTTSAKVKDKKSKAEKKAAKAKYVKRIKAAKKSYAKALDKAGSSKSKKAAAKKAYRAKRTSAKATYAYAIAGFTIVKKTNTVSDVRAFTITTPAQNPSSIG